MITELKIQGYRGFREYSIGGLERVNLLVGTNNCGKTSILEAVRLLFDPLALGSTMEERGERLEDGESRHRREFDVCHLFHGHTLKAGETIRISSNESRWLSLSVAAVPRDKMEPTLPGFEAEDRLLSILVEGQPKPATSALRLNFRRALPADEMERAKYLGKEAEESSPVLFLSPSAVSSSYIMRTWPSIALTPEEDQIVKALQILEPGIEGFRVIGPSQNRPNETRGNVIVKCRGWSTPVPIGSMGEGMWRILVMAMALIQARNGTLLVDEIDTGLHYSIMEKMWRMVSETAKRLDIQVLATTHSWDCVASIASICSKNGAIRSGVSIQRIEAQGKKAVAFSESEIIQAAEQKIEIR